MTDLELTEACAEAAGLTVVEQLGRVMFPNTQLGSPIYDPLHDDAQAMALVKKFNLWLTFRREKWQKLVPYDHVWGAGWFHHQDDPVSKINTQSKDLNRAICECVAKIGRAR
mgnify:CR=1 FL=1